MLHELQYMTAAAHGPADERGAAIAMQGRGIAIRAGEIRQHRLQHARIKLRGGVVIEIDGHAVILPSAMPQVALEGSSDALKNPPDGKKPPTP